MKSTIVLVLITAIASVLLAREFFPRRVVDRVQIPVIVPRYDTVETLPKWYADSLAYWKKRKHTTDTVPLLVSNTIVAGAPINVIATPEERPDLWPVLDFSGGTRLGDTAIVSSLSIRSGRVAISKFYTLGILTGIHMDSARSVPKLDFKPFPAPKGPSFLYKLKMMGLGVVTVGGAAAIISLGGKVF